MKKRVTEIGLNDIKRFSSEFWMICGLMATVLCAGCLFIANMDMTLSKGFSVPFKETKDYSLIFPFTLMVTIPIFSFMADRVFNKATYILFSCFLGVIVYSVGKESKGMESMAGPVLFGIALYHAIFMSVIWSAGSLMCPDDLTDIGLAILNTVLSFCNFLYPIILVKLRLMQPGHEFEVYTVLLAFGGLFALMLIRSKNIDKLEPNPTDN